MSSPGAVPAAESPEEENRRLRAINAALIDRAESDGQGSHTDFSMFHATVLLEDQVRSRTRALDHALRQLEVANAELRQSRAQLQAIFDVVPTPLAVSLAEDGTFVGVSRSFADLLGTTPQGLVGRRAGADDVGLWPTPSDRDRFMASLEETDGPVTDIPLDLATPAGVVHLLVSGQLLDIDGRRLVLTQLHDVTQVHRDALRLRTLAERDPLTGLPNRLLLLQRLAMAVAGATPDGHRVGVCYLDLDGFKPLSDRFGHAAGDQVLVEIGRRLGDVVRDSDTVGRIGGDEFALVLCDLGGPGECDEILQRALTAVARPIRASTFTGSLTASIGYTLAPDDGAPAEDLLDHADRALYSAKRAGRNRVERFAVR